MEEIGRFQIPYLYQYWQRVTETRQGQQPERSDWDLDNTLLSGLGLNVLETSRFLHDPQRPAGEVPSFSDFEEWILATNGGEIEEARLTRLRDALAGRPVSSEAGSLNDVPGLTTEELDFWDENGYVVLHDAVNAADRDAAAAAIYQTLDADPSVPDSWYGNKFGKSIWVPVLRSPALSANRRSPRIVKAFAQLWGREDLWPTIDQCGLNPPEREGWRFPGPNIHWDMTLAPPLCFGIQGILYLTDTPAEQGAFSCIPGFHRILEKWLKDLPLGTDPREAILHHEGFLPVAGRAGDMVIWHHALPHGSSPNRGQLPRVVQYLTLRPTRWPYTREWK